MDTLRGAVSNCQHTLQVSGGANNTSTSTTYIALFRVGGRPVEFRTSRPTSVSDGDQVVVAGLSSSGALTVLAFRNVTTGEVTNAGIWSYLIGAILLPVIGILICIFAASTFGGLVIACIVLVAGLMTAYLVHRAILTIRAEKLVSA